MRHTLPELTTVTLERPRAGVAVLTLDRPERYNATTDAMTDTMFGELESVALALDHEDALRVLIVTGAGRGFCAGDDLADADELASLGAMGILDLQERAARALAAIRLIRVPVVAAVNGPTAGSGLALALAADVRFAAPTATFSAAFVTIGLSAGDLGTSWLLPRLIGPAAAAEFCYTGTTMDAAGAERTGLVNRVVPTDDLLPAALETAGLICANSPGGVQDDLRHWPEPGGRTRDSLLWEMIMRDERLEYSFESGAAIVHNDYRLGNVILGDGPPGRVVAVLDWELATIGDPLFDVGYLLASYPQPGEPLVPTAALGAAVPEPGWPTRAELAARYAAATGRDLSDLRWYTVLALWKLTVLFAYSRRGVDPYYDDPSLVTSFLDAAVSGTMMTFPDRPPASA